MSLGLRKEKKIIDKVENQIREFSLYSLLELGVKVNLALNRKAIILKNKIGSKK